MGLTRLCGVMTSSQGACCGYIPLKSQLVSIDMEWIKTADIKVPAVVALRERENCSRQESYRLPLSWTELCCAKQ